MDGWHKTTEGALVYHDPDSFFGGDYTWSGDTLEMGVANGKGVLTFKDNFNNDNDFTKNLTIYSGAVDKPSNLNRFTVGKLDEKHHLCGFGARVYGSSKYIGYFDKGNLDGKGVYYRDDILVYKGEFKDGSYHGKGKLYFGDGSSVKYDGKFKNNRFEGKGILYDSIGNKIYVGKFSKGLYDGYGIAYDSLGRETRHVWTKGGIDAATAGLYGQLIANRDKLTPTQFTQTRKRLVAWERYHVWMYIGWGVFAAILALGCIGFADEDIKTRYDRATYWNKYLVWLDWLFLGWLGAHRYALRSKFGLIYPALVICLLVANIREASVFLFYPSTWCLWTIGPFSNICLSLMVVLLLFDFLWIPWRCYELNHTYYRHDKHEDIILRNSKTPIMKFGESVAPTANREAANLSSTLKQIQTIHKREFKGEKGFLTRIGRAFTGNDPWLNFEKQRAREIQAQARIAEKAQNNYAEMCEKLNTILAESRSNAYRNFALAKELITMAIASNGKTQELVSDVELNTDRLAVTTSVESVAAIECGIDWESTTNSAIKSSSMLLSMGMKGPWAIGIGVGVSLLSSALNAVNAAQKACEEANRQCAEAISQLRDICNAVTESQAKILRAGELIIALNKANEAFWRAYVDLRDRVFDDEPSFRGFFLKAKVSEEDSSDVAFRRAVIHLAQVCSEYNKINTAKL